MKGLPSFSPHGQFPFARQRRLSLQRFSHDSLLATGLLLNSLANYFCLFILVASAISAGYPRLVFAQQPGPFASPGDDYGGGGFAPPVATNNPANFGGPSSGPPANDYPPTTTYPITNAPASQAGFPAPGPQPSAAQFQPNGSPAADGAELLEGGQIIARIGSQIVVSGDVIPRVMQIVKTQLANMPPEQRAQIPPEELDKVKQHLMQRELISLIETKLLFDDAKRTIPAENFPKVLEKLGEQFDKAELPHLLEDAKAANRQELDQKFIEQGSSLAQQRQAYVERLLATEWLKQQVNFKKQSHHNEMLAYYREHLSDFEFEAKAKFEEIMVRFERFPNKAAAYAALADIGNQILSGAPLADLARTHSHGPTAREGGQYDFVRRGSLVLPILNEAVFTLPVGQLSQILESPQGFHIIRVLERTDAGRQPFEEAQVEISKKLQRAHADKQIKDYLTRLRRDTRVWTVFDNPAAQQALKPE